MLKTPISYKQIDVNYFFVVFNFPNYAINALYL